MTNSVDRFGLSDLATVLMRRRARWTVLLLVLLAAGTWAFGAWKQHQALASLDQRLDLERQASFSAIQGIVDAEYSSLASWARDLASDPGVAEGLRRVDAGREDGKRILVAWAAMQTHGQREFIEVYDPTPALQAWSGAAFPMDGAVRNDRFLLQELESLAIDGDKRTAFTAWVPVLDEATIVGAIRVGRMVEQRVPVRNEYLRDYTWDEEWSREIGQSVVFTFGADSPRSKDGRFILRSPSDVHLGYVDIETPSEVQWVAAFDRSFLNIQLFWLFAGMMLALGALSTLLWREAKSKQISGSVVALYGLFLVSVRWGMLALDMPSRWQLGKAPLSPLFDPQHLASVVGMGAMRTIGDLLISAILVTLFTVVFLRATNTLRKRVQATLRFKAGGFTGNFWAFLCVQQVVMWAGAFLLFEAAHHAVLDATLDYFERSGLLPGRLVLVVFAALLMTTFSVVLLMARIGWVLADRFRLTMQDLPSAGPTIVSALAVMIPVLLIDGLLIPGGAPVSVIAVVSVMTWLAVWVGPAQPAGQSPIVALRRIVPLIVLTSMVLFPMMEISVEDKARIRMVEAAESFLADRDARAMFAISEVLDAADDTSFQRGWESGVLDSVPLERARMDSLAEELTVGFMLSALSSYDVTVTLFAVDGSVRGRYSNVARRLPRSLRDAEDETEFILFAAMFEEFGSSGNMVEKLTGSTDQNRFRYAGFRDLESDGFLLVRAEQRALAESAGTPFPKVLAPAGYYGDRYADLSIAEFRGGVVTQTEGQHYGRSVLDADVIEVLKQRAELWRSERIRDRSYLTFYRVQENVALDAEQQVTAVRRSISNVFDQLYHLLRIIVGGLLLCLPIYLAGVLFRFWRYVPERGERHFRDRVLNAFFTVGAVTVVAMGVVGLRVVTGENERAIESWLRQHLDRVEETLELEVRGEELPYRVLDRVSVDSLAARVGVDLVVYNNLEVEQASRPELIRDRLIERRLPVEAYEALYFDGFRFVAVDEQLGEFAYTAGYRALTDEQGVPRYVVAIPTLPEQERIEEERARTVAYLFGALLLLVLVVMVTASLLANTLTRPIARLRTGLQSVAAGHFERISPIDSGDEIADLVDSFNTMQDQLEDSRSLLAQQERQLAWREMARQVAHEIKNPLTPMKLSIQHLRSAFSRRATDGSDEERFAEKFKQTTTTLIEQIDTLARIANEFSSFGRMPTHIKEDIDLNQVIDEAVGLMRSEENVAITTKYADERVLVHGDREALRRVYINFLKNGIQAVPEGRDVHMLVETAIELDEQGRSWALGRVSDNGSGIPRALWDKIFVPSFSTKTSGTGLGLAIARKTIENMDGEIGFDTAFEEGTTFWIRVPLHMPEKGERTAG